MKSHDQSAMLRHLLATLAYRTKRALSNAPVTFATFEAGKQVRTPIEIVRHMTSVLGYARAHFGGGRYRAEPLPSLEAEMVRLEDMIRALAGHLERGTPLRGMTEARLLQGPLSDALTHVGQIAMLRRMSGSPVPPENFIEADITPATGRRPADHTEPGSLPLE